MSEIALLIAQAAITAFAPPLDRPLTYRVSEVRQDDARTQRFTIDRRVTFRRAADGYTAEIETLAVTGQAGRAGAMFEAMASAMLGRRVVARLDRAGKVVDIDDLDALWNAQLAAIARMLSSKDPARVAAVEPLLAPLRALPHPAKVARIAEMIAPLVVDRLFVPYPSRSITLPARGPDGQSAMLAGTERVVVEPDRRLLLERRAGGVVAGSPMSVSLRRRIDQATGLVVETVSVETTEVAGTRMIVTRSTLLNF